MNSNLRIPILKRSSYYFLTWKTMNEIDKKLYELFADKTLSEGCVIKNKAFYNDNVTWIIRSVVSIRFFSEDVLSVRAKVFWKKDSNEENISFNNIEILWHEPHLHDVFRLSKEKLLFPLVQTEDFTNYYIGIAWENTPYREIPYNPAITLLKQEESTKQAIIDLFKN